MRKGAKGTKYFGVDIDEVLADEFKSFATDRGETIRQAVEMAMRRHMAYPPAPPTVEPLPDSPVKPGRKRKGE